ncbi:MAG TPA: VacJ family lipoprotein [Psychromonas hadalis]|nr:VacJ family lipoprotein [Psychromonas hadalis]
MNWARNALILLLSFALFSCAQQGGSTPDSNVENTPEQKQSTPPSEQSTGAEIDDEDADLLGEIEEEQQDSTQASSTDEPTKEKDEISDPLEPVNRAIWYLNYDILDSYIYKPTTELYVDWVWDGGRKGVNNFVLNFDEPSTFVNNLIQLEFIHAGKALVRFTLNSTVGILGIFDVAKMLGIERRRETFSNVLGRWHVPDGPYLMVPILGPRTTRKLVGSIVDGLYFPFSYLNLWQKGALWAGDGIDKREKVLPQDPLVEQSLDSYQFVKDAYIQYDAFKISDNNTDMGDFIEHQKENNREENNEEDEDLDDFMDEID